MSRRKSERKLPRDHFYQPYGPGHPVEQSIARGTQWFAAWTFQYSLPRQRLKKMTGIQPDRADQLERGASITLAEVRALATACGNQPDDVIASLPDPALLKDG